MIIVKVELHSAITGKVTEIGRMKISNDGTGSNEVCNYDGKVMRKGTNETVQREGRVLSHRRHDYPVWTLVRKMLESMKF